jgi:hypothetical protein
MKEYTVFVTSPETAFRVIKIKAKDYEVGGTVLVFTNDGNIVAQFLTSKIIGVSESSAVV